MRKIINRSGWVYLGLALILGVGTISALLTGSIPQEELWMQDILRVGIFAFIYGGLLRQKPWVIPLIRITAATACVLLVAQILYPVGDRKAVVAKLLNAAFFAFFAHQFIFFGKERVRTFFQDTGLTVF